MESEELNIEEHLKILRALAEGRNPFSGQPLPDESVYQSAKVLRALLEAVKVLENRAKRKKELPGSAGRPWTEEENAALVKAFDLGAAVEQLAKLHQRTRGAIQSRLIKAGKLLPWSGNVPETKEPLF